MSLITSEQVIRWLDRFAGLVTENKDYLTQLDAAIGDADHGANMDRGFQAVLARKADLAGKDITTILKTVEMTLLSTVGGASGPLYGTFFLQASQAAGGKSEISPEEFGVLLEKALAGILQRGKAAPGDKTMVDDLQPAVDTYQATLQSCQPFAEALLAASTPPEKAR